MRDTLKSPIISTKLQQIAEQAAHYPERVFINLAHHINLDMLYEAYHQTRKDKAAGVDKVAGKEYGSNLDSNLRELYFRLKNDLYKAQPVKRVWIDKEPGKKRPLGIPCFEDKIVQRAVAMLMSAIYEQDFYDFSYGFREGRSPLDAIKRVREMCNQRNIGWIVDADVSGYFDNIDHNWLRIFLKQRVNDGGILKLIGKWLNAGVMEEGNLCHPDKGSPQGSVISPLLANIVLHHVLDEWFVKEVQPRLKGQSFIVRFADDFIIGCEHEEDARRVMEILPKRFARFGLTIHPDKTVLESFRNPDRKPKGEVRNGTFDFVGFTHYWAKSLKGNWVIKRKTASKRLRRTVKSIWIWCRNNRHMPGKEQYQIFCSKLRGHFQYYGIRCNMRSMEKVYEQAKRAWRYWLSRRSHTGKVIWEKYELFLERNPLPSPRIIHSV